MRILVFDNYDSFTYNLVHLIEKITDEEVEVFRNDKIDINDVAAFDKIVLSPGPGVPSEAGILIPLIKKYAADKSILGVCLGQQAIAEAFGGSLINLSDVYHGISTPVKVVSEDVLFNNLPSRFNAGRYHSWVVDEATLPAEIEVTARDDKNYIMALRHKKYDVRGVQFHPESIMTEHGEQLIKNWLRS